ncbi:MAG: hypothetical protein FWH11_05040 [Micrococcales bacterium]|nr:hypothetical protein [Micrococcales bacterium]
MKKLAAVLGAAILGLGLVAGCDQSSNSGDSRSRGGALDNGRGSNGDGDQIDVEQWFDDYLVATSQMTTVHAAIDQEISLSGQNVTDQNVKAHMEIDMDATKSAYSMTITMDLTGMITEVVSAEAVIIDGTTYISIDGEVREMSIDELGLSESDLNPAASIKQQRNSITKVELVGSEKVGGVETNHYIVTHDVAEMNKMLGSKTLEGEVQTIETDFWLDSDMRMIKYRSIMTVKADAAGSIGTVTLEAVYSDYGKPVTITAPK